MAQRLPVAFQRSNFTPVSDTGVVSCALLDGGTLDDAETGFKQPFGGSERPSAAKAKRVQHDGEGGRVLPAAWIIEGG